jgi:polyisoprenoid-binding protein YceI
LRPSRPGSLPEHDDHIRSTEFLDVALHREIRLKRTSVVPAGDGRFLVTGILTVRGLVREVSLEVEDPGRSLPPDVPLS